MTAPVERPSAETAARSWRWRLFPLCHPLRAYQSRREVYRMGQYASDLAHRVASGQRVYPWPDAPQDVAYLAWIIHKSLHFDGSRAQQ